MNTLALNFRGEIAALSAAFLWSLAAIYYSRLTKYISPPELNLLKCLLATGMLLLTNMFCGEIVLIIDPLALRLLLLSGAVGIGLGDTAYFEALRCLGPRRALLMAITAPPMAGLIALVFLGEQLGFAAWGGIVVTGLGVAWVVSERATDARYGSANLFRGVAFGLLAALGQATGAVLSRLALTQTGVGPLSSAIVRLGAGAVTLVVLLPIVRQPVGRWLVPQQFKKLWGMILFATFAGTYLGIWLQQVSLKFTETGIAQTLLSTSPIFVLPTVALMGEKVSFRAVLGAFVALGGVAMLFVTR